MTARIIDFAVAKDELTRINATLKSPILLVGGMAVQQYRVTRSSKDLDLVWDHELGTATLDQLYPSEEWEVCEENDDEFRPSYRIRHRTCDLGEIAIGPKITQREPYKYIDWAALLPEARPFRYKKTELRNILVPSATGLAYTKLLSFIDRRAKRPDKGRQDLKDFVDLSNDHHFAPILFLALIQKGAAAEYVRTNLRLNDAAEIDLFGKSSIAALQNVFGVAHAPPPVPPSDAGAGGPARHEMSAIVKEIATIALKHHGKRPLETTAQSVLIVVDVQKDFFEGGALAAADTVSVIAPLNELIRRADSAGVEIVLTRDWHPPDHSSFKDWGVHCVAETDGASFHPGLHIPPRAIVIDIGTANDMDGYSPFVDPKFRLASGQRPNEDHLCCRYRTGVLRVSYLQGRDMVWEDGHSRRALHPRCFSFGRGSRTRLAANHFAGRD